MISLTLPPEQNPLPVPVSNTTLTSSSCARSAMTFAKSAYVWNVSALSFSGLFRRRVATPLLLSKTNPS